MRAPMSDGVVEVRADEPVFAGHYPGDPVLPGVCVVECVYRAHAGGGELAAIESARFRKPVRPGDTLVVAGDTVTSAGEVVATVRLRYGGHEPTAPVESAVGPPLDAGEITRLLPHRPPILLVDSVDAHAPDALVASWTPRTDEPWCVPGQPYPVALVVESWCQAAGVLAVQAGEPGGTMLLGSVQGAVFGDRVRLGERIEHRVRMTRSFGDTAMLSGQSLVAGRVVLSVKRIVVALRQAAGTEAG